MKKQITILSIVLLITALLPACAPSRSGAVYTRDQARTAHTVTYGSVISVAPVSIEGTQTGAGVLGGGALGGVLGSMVGGGRGSVLGAVAGAVGGGLAGAAVEKGVTTRQGLEITVQLDNGQIISVVQEGDEPFNRNDRVMVLRSVDGSARVRHY